MQCLVTISLRTGIAMPDGGYSPVLVGYMGEKINAGSPVSLSDGIVFAAQQAGFLLHANEAGSSIKVLVYEDAISGICACIVPPAEACDLRHFNIEAAMHNLQALDLYQQQLLQVEETDEQDGGQHAGDDNTKQIDDDPQGQAQEERKTYSTDELLNAEEQGAE